MFRPRVAESGFKFARSYAIAKAIPLTRSQMWPFFTATACATACIMLHNQLIKNDVAVSPKVIVDPNLDPFPRTLAKKEFPTVYNMLGYGFRSVNLITFKVYAMAFYYAQKDKHLIGQALNHQLMDQLGCATGDHQKNVYDALMDPEKSRSVINALLDSKIRLMIDITPVRTTNIAHLRDGFSKSTLAHPDSKKYEAELKQGIEQFKAAFTRKGSCPKGHTVFLELDEQGGLQLYYREAQNASTIEKMGYVAEPAVGRLLISQYLSGESPLSPSTRESVAKHIANLV